MKKTKKNPFNGTEPLVERPTIRSSLRDDELNTSEDDALISRCRAGNMVAYGQLVERYQDRLYNAMLRMVNNRDDALELTQEAFYKALKGLKKFRGSSGFYTWLYRIGINLSINHHRKRQRVQFVSTSETDDYGGHQADKLSALTESGERGPVERLQLRESHSRILKALDSLDAAARAVVVLRDIEELDYAQIARILEVPVGTVKSRLSRARLALRNSLTQDDD